MSDIEYRLCGKCHQITPVVEWEGFGEDGDPVYGNEEPTLLRCPGCDYDHIDSDDDPGVWSGSLAEMQEQHGALHMAEDEEEQPFVIGIAFGDAEALPPAEVDAMIQAVTLAGDALTARLERLEIVHGDVGLMFLTDTDARLIRRGLRALIRNSVKDVDYGHARVLAAEMQVFIEGLEHEIQRSRGEDSGGEA